MTQPRNGRRSTGLASDRDERRRRAGRTAITAALPQSQPANLFKLRPPESIDTEVCECRNRRRIKLMYALEANPLRCLKCNRQVALETLALSDKLVEDVASWRSLYAGVYALWLDSGEYEAWAEAELSSIHSYVNRTGIETRNRLGDVIDCFYWLFQSESTPPLTVCPLCGRRLTALRGGPEGHLICRASRIVTAWPG